MRVADQFIGAQKRAGEDKSGPLGVAATVAIRKGEDILLLRRPPDVGHDPGLWELPGGKMSYGETLMEAAAREVAEETGIRISILRPLVVWHFLKEPFWVTGVTFDCEHVDGEVCLSREHTDYRWTTPEEALGLPLGTTVRGQIESLLADRGGSWRTESR
jgi:8-oxo-dGTP pyrophosphatase MutT (NUDIX family)